MLDAGLFRKLKRGPQVIYFTHHGLADAAARFGCVQPVVRVTGACFRE